MRDYAALIDRCCELFLRYRCDRLLVLSSRSSAVLPIIISGCGRFTIYSTYILPSLSSHLSLLHVLKVFVCSPTWKIRFPVVSSLPSAETTAYTWTDSLFLTRFSSDRAIQLWLAYGSLSPPHVQLNVPGRILLLIYIAPKLLNIIVFF